MKTQKKMLFSLLSLSLLLLFACDKDSPTGMDTGTSQLKATLLNSQEENPIVPSGFKSLFASGGKDEKGFDPSIVYAAVAGDQIWVHIENGPSKTMYQPKDWKHVDEGADATRYVFSEGKHIETGLDKTLLAPEDWIHIWAGDMATHMGPPNFYHVTFGPDKSRYFMDDYWHIASGPNTTYFEPIKKE